MTAYIIITITALLGLGGLIFKTKKDEKKGVFNKLTTTGYVVLFLLLASLLVNFWSQNEKDKAADLERKAATDKAINDSIRFSNKGLIDSLRFVTTSQKLQEQRSIDSTKIVTDSNRFDITLSKFLEQSNKQDKALDNLQEIKHPLFPLRITGTVAVDIEAMEFSDTILKTVNKFRTYLKQKESKAGLPSTLNLDFVKQGVIHYEIFNPNETASYDDEFNKFNQFICTRILPAIRIDIFSNSQNHIQIFNHGGLQFKKGLTLTYLINPQNIAYFDFEYYPTEQDDNRGIKSLYSCKDGFIDVSINQNLESGFKGFYYKQLTLNCGTNYSDSYYFSFGEKDIKKSDNYSKTYFKLTKPVLTK